VLSDVQLRPRESQRLVTEPDRALDRLRSVQEKRKTASKIRPPSYNSVHVYECSYRHQVGRVVQCKSGTANTPQ